jgi:hypothetical protein
MAHCLVCPWNMSCRKPVIAPVTEMLSPLEPDCGYTAKRHASQCRQMAGCGFSILVNC